MSDRGNLADRFNDLQRQFDDLQTRVQQIQQRVPASPPQKRSRPARTVGTYDETQRKVVNIVFLDGEASATPSDNPATYQDRQDAATTTHVAAMLADTPPSGTVIPVFEWGGVWWGIYYKPGVGGGGDVNFACSELIESHDGQFICTQNVFDTISIYAKPDAIANWDENKAQALCWITSGHALNTSAGGSTSQWQWVDIGGAVLSA